MELKGEYQIPAAQEDVWQALNNADILGACIPGCETMEKIGDSQFNAVAKVKVGPVSAKFTGKVTLSDLNPPHSYRISGEGQGGAAGFAKGGAQVNLTPNGDGTLLSYTVDATVGGKLAQIGQRFIDATAKKMADEFFSTFSTRLGGEPEEAPTPVSPVKEEGLPGSLWTILLIAGFILLVGLIVTLT